MHDHSLNLLYDLVRSFTLDDQEIQISLESHDNHLISHDKMSSNMNFIDMTESMLLCWLLQSRPRECIHWP